MEVPPFVIASEAKVCALQMFLAIHMIKRLVMAIILQH